MARLDSSGDTYADATIGPDGLLQSIQWFLPRRGGLDHVAVTAASGVSWTAASNATWITITSGAVGTGNGTVNYSVDANTTGASRSGTMTIGGQTFSVTEAALVAGGPSNVSVTPSSTASPNPGPVTFTFVASDPNGYAYIDWVTIIFNGPLQGGSACFLYYNQQSNFIALNKDGASGWVDSSALGTAGKVISNSQCSVDVAASQVSGSGANLSLSVALTFTPQFLGPQNIFMNLGDHGGNSNSWLPALGTWTAYPASTQLPTNSVLPGSGTGMSATLAFHFNDVNGWGYMPQVMMFIGPFANGGPQPNGCYFLYLRPYNALALMNDAGNDWGPNLFPGSPGTRSNSQCAVDASQVTITHASGTDLTVTLPIAFTAAFQGAKTVYAYVYDHANQTPGWQTVGSWTVGNPAPPSITGLSPTSGAAGVQVTVSGSGFGLAQGTGSVWLGSTLGAVVSWSNTQIIATVSSSSASGIAQVRQGGAWSNALPFNVSTATISTVSPASGLPGAQVTITGSGFGVSQGGGQVWLGTANGVIQSWGDTQIVALVASRSASGKAQVLQNGVWSNAVPFSVPTPQITGISPASGSSGTSVTITGAGFGSAQGAGSVLLGSTGGQVISWSDTQVIAAVAPTALTGIVRIQQNGVSSNAIAFTVPVSGSGAVTLVPNTLNLMVGDTHTIQALGSNGQSVTGLTWTSSNANVVSLSTDNPPILTALAAGHVTITAGTASADVTISAGAVPLGTVLWSNPGGGSGVIRIVPAVPSASGVADVLALQDAGGNFAGYTGSIQAITSDGTTAWTDNLAVPVRTVLPDFQGGVVTLTNTSITKLDGLTGQPRPAYTVGTGFGVGSMAVYTDGTIIAVQSSFATGTTVIGIDPTTGTQKFSVALEPQPFVPYYLTDSAPCSPNYFSQADTPSTIIGGDGYAYVAYSYPEYACAGSARFIQTTHFMLLRIDSAGVYDKIKILDYTPGIFAQSVEFIVGMITNADTGILLTWRGAEHSDAAPDVIIPDGMAITTGASLRIVSAPAVPVPAGWTTLVVPLLQAQDGSFVGVAGDQSNPQHNMVAFDATGSVRWTVPYEAPLIATADGGVIGQSGITYDQNGNATGQIANLPTYSWLGNAYRVGSVDQVVANTIYAATSFWAFQGANNSRNGTAVQQPWYAPLKSCPGAAIPCPQEAITSALGALKTLLQSPCPGCKQWVFDRLPGTDQTSFFKFLSLPPRLYDGTRSYAPQNVAFCPSGFFNQLNCAFPSTFPFPTPTVHEYFTRNPQTDAVSQTPADKGRGMQIFFKPATGICNVLSILNPQANDRGVLNQAVLFHEALHGYSGKFDVTLESAFLGNTNVASVAVTYYLEDNANPSAPQGARLCGN